jgi:transcriptional regulator
MPADVERVADAMYEMVKEYDGKKNLKAMDLIKAMIERFGDDCDKKLAKSAIRILIDGGRCTYSYVGGSYVVLNPDYDG